MPDLRALDAGLDAIAIGRITQLQSPHENSLDGVEPALAELAERALDSASRYGGGGHSASNDHDRLRDFFERHLCLLAPPREPEDSAAQARAYYLGVAESAPAQGPLLEAQRALAASVERVLAEHLAATRREPRSHATLAELTTLVVALLAGLALQLRVEGDLTPRDLANAAIDAVDSWTRHAANGAQTAEACSVEDRVRQLDRELSVLSPTSPSALSLVVELMSLAPRSTLAFWRARHYATPLLAQRTIRDSAIGDRAWTHAAEMLAMADADRVLAEEVARITLARDPAANADDPVALLRGAWLLLRLEKLGAALRYIADFRTAGALDDDAATAADALEAYAFAAIGPPDRALDHAGRAMSGSGLGATLGASVAIRLLARSERFGEARDLIAKAPGARQPADMGATSFLIARGTLAARTHRPSEALHDLAMATDQMRRVGSTNPSGWPWLEPMVHALVQLDQAARARAIIDKARPAVVAWATPIVTAELHRAEARLATSPEEAERHGRAAMATLAESEAQLECTYVADELRQLTATMSLLDNPNATSKAALTPRVLEVSLLVADGLRDREIAEALHLSPRTVHRHVATALLATGARNRTDLARIMHASHPGSGRGQPERAR